MMVVVQLKCQQPALIHCKCIKTINNMESLFGVVIDYRRRNGRLFLSDMSVFTLCYCYEPINQ